MSSLDARLGAKSGKPNPTDLAFLLFLVLVLAAVALMGAFTFREGLKTEATKSQGEAFVAWLNQASTKRAEPDFVPAACAVNKVGQPATWAECSAALMGEGGPLATWRNAFSGQPVGLIARCDPTSPVSPGQFVIERVSATPPGSAVPLLVTPFAPDDTVNKPLTLKLTVCDKGGYGIKVGEAQF